MRWWEREPLDALHREPWLPRRGHSGVVEACDVRMLEAREDVALPAGALAPRGVGLVRRGKLERHIALDAAVGLACQPDLSHAATAEDGDELERPDRLARGVRARASLDQRQAAPGLELARARRALVRFDHPSQDRCDVGARG